MPIVEQFFDYRTFFINAIRFLAAKYPDGCNNERHYARRDFLRECRTVHVNIGRVSGKTTAMIDLGREMAKQGGAVLIVMNPALKRHVYDMANSGCQYLEIKTISEIQKELHNPGNIQKYQFVMVDESEYTLTSRDKTNDLYKWAEYAKADFVLKS